MDPNMTLQLLREALDNVNELDGDAADRAREDACEYMRFLITWIDRGGYLPAAWMGRQ